MSKYDQAIAESDSLIRFFREASQSPHPVRCLLRDIWLYRHNTPYMTTLYEANQEMIAPLMHTNGQSH
jgi:hypothetical protein